MLSNFWFLTLEEISTFLHTIQSAPGLARQRDEGRDPSGPGGDHGGTSQMQNMFVWPVGDKLGMFYTPLFFYIYYVVLFSD